MEEWRVVWRNGGWCGGMEGGVEEWRVVLRNGGWCGGVVTMTETVANVRAAPELPSCADSQIAKSQRYTHNTKHTLSIQPLPAKFPRQV